MLSRIHITGASGSGTTTLGAAIAERFGHRHLDTDLYFWLPTDPPFRRKRPIASRQSLLRRAMAAWPRWVVTGSLCGWGDCFIPQFDLVIFMTLPAEIRMARLRAREEERYGADSLVLGGPMNDVSRKFLEWAALYDSSGNLLIRSRAMHESWLAGLSCPVLRLDGPMTVDEELARIQSFVLGLPCGR